MTVKAPHREDIKAEIRKRGSTLAILSSEAGLSRRTGSYALVVPIPTANKAIAKFLGKTLHELWPHWYDQNGERILSSAVSETSRKSASRHCKKSSHKSAEGDAE